MSVIASTTALRSTISGIVVLEIANTEPNRIVTVAPVVLCSVVYRCRNRAARPIPAPSTIPVARSRPRARCTPIASIAPAAITLPSTNPHSGPMPTRYAPAPPVVPRSPNASPAKDWPRMTVNTPTTPVTTATSAPTARAMCTASLSKNPGAKIGDRKWLTTGPPDSREDALVARQVGVLAGAGDDQHAAVDVQDVDVVAVELAEHIGADDLLGGAADRAPGGEVDDAVHDGQQRVDLVRGDQHRDLLLAGDAGEQRHDFVGAAQVEVRQRLIEQQQPRPGDQRVRDQDALLLAAGELADARVGEALGVDRVQHLLDERPPGPGGPRHAEAVRVDPEPHEIARAQRNIRVEQELLRHVADQAMPASVLAGRLDQHAPRARRLQAEDHPEQRRLARPV